MSLEQALAANTAALEANTAALKGGAAAGKTEAAAGKTEAAAKGKASPKEKKPEHTRAELTAVMNELKEAKGASVAKGLIKEVSGSEKLAEVPDSKIDALFDAAKEALGGGDDDGEEGDGL